MLALCEHIEYTSLSFSYRIFSSATTYPPPPPLQHTPPSNHSLITHQIPLVRFALCVELGEVTVGGGLTAAAFPPLLSPPTPTPGGP